MQIEEYIIPKKNRHKGWLRTLTFGIVDSFYNIGKYSVIEARVPERYLGKSLGEADVTNRYNVIVLTVLKLSKESENGVTKTFKTASCISTPNTVMHELEVLVQFGKLTDIKKLMH